MCNMNIANFMVLFNEFHAIFTFVLYFSDFLKTDFLSIEFRCFPLSILNKLHTFLVKGFLHNFPAFFFFQENS